MTLELLEREEVSSSLRDKYEYIFVDEYQDSNIVQETIVKKICRENNPFFWWVTSSRHLRGSGWPTRLSL